MSKQNPSSIPSNPDNWSEKSKQTVTFEFGFRKEYKDISYQCRRCSKPAVFTAADQQFTYEVKKAHIDQNRILCKLCWRELNDVLARLDQCEEMWRGEKEVLMHDMTFLSAWLELVTRRDEYIPYRPDTAKKNMLQRLLGQPSVDVENSL
jgi:hypothetical protein